MDEMVVCETIRGGHSLVPRDSLRPRRTAYGVVCDSHGRLLAIELVETRKLVLPGGGVEQGESEQTALRREVAEETGVLVEPGPVVGDADAFYWDESSRKRGTSTFAACSAPSPKRIPQRWDSRKGLPSGSTRWICLRRIFKGHLGSSWPTMCCEVPRHGAGRISSLHLRFCAGPGGSGGKAAMRMSQESWSQVGPWREPADLVGYGFGQSRVVIMNEAHDGWKRCVRTRVVGRSILPAAHEAGVRDLAMEALFPHSFVLAANRLRRVPPKDEGYLSQPDMRALIQAALDLGWTLWPYEADLEKRPVEVGDDFMTTAFTNWREREQAKNLAHILQQLPESASLLVWCGNSHGYKLAYGGEWTPMGWHLIREAELVPFVIDQTLTVFSPQLVEPLRETLEARGGTAGLLRQDAGPLSHRHDVDAFVFSLDNDLR